MAYTPMSRKLAISKLLELPITHMKNKAGGMTDASLIAYDVPSFEVYSAHDFQIANILTQLFPSMNYTEIPYASNIQFELYQKGLSFYVTTSYNGKKLPFDECAHELDRDGTTLAQPASSENGSYTIVFGVSDIGWSRLFGPDI